MVRIGLFFSMLGACSEVEGESQLASMDLSAAARRIVVDDDFEGYPLGPLGQPWSVVTNPGSRSAANVAAVPVGQVLELIGSATPGDFVIATLDFQVATRRAIALHLDIRPESGSAFVVSLEGAGPTGQIRLQREPGTDILEAQSKPTGTVQCGQVPDLTWSVVVLTVDVSGPVHTFDVLIDGQPTACTGLPTGLSSPFEGLSVMDARNPGWGGSTRFDALQVGVD